MGGDGLFNVEEEKKRVALFFLRRTQWDQTEADNSPTAHCPPLTLIGCRELNETEVRRGL